MNWQKMKKLEPRLEALEQQARDAGQAGRPWSETWKNDLYEPLSKLVGWSSGGRFTTARDYEIAHKGLLMAWAIREETLPPWLDAEGETTPMFPAFSRVTT